MRIGKKLIPTVLILSFVLLSGLSADSKPGLKNSSGSDIIKRVSGKRVGSFPSDGMFFSLLGNNYYYWLSPDIITDIKKMILKKEQTKRTARSGNVKQMFSIMHL